MYYLNEGFPLLASHGQDLVLEPWSQYIALLLKDFVSSLCWILQVGDLQGLVGGISFLFLHCFFSPLPGSPPHSFSHFPVSFSPFYPIHLLHFPSTPRGSLYPGKPWQRGSYFGTLKAYSWIYSKLNGKSRVFLPATTANPHSPASPVLPTSSTATLLPFWMYAHYIQYVWNKMSVMLGISKSPKSWLLCSLQTLDSNMQGEAFTAMWLLLEYPQGSFCMLSLQPASLLLPFNCQWL